MQNKTVIFVYNRNGPHPTHKKYGESVQAYFQIEDFILPWAEKDHSKALRRYMSWILCGLFFPTTKDTRYIISDCIRFPLYFKLKFRIRKPRQKIIGFLDDETLYFLFSGYYSKRTTAYLTDFIRSFDGILVVGKFQTELLQRICGSKTPPFKTLVNGINDERYRQLCELKPQFAPVKFVTIANGPGGFRVWYKGLDLMLKVMGNLHLAGRTFEYLIIGNWSAAEMENLYASVPETYRGHVKFTGEQQDFSGFLNGASFYLHCARGEAWGISVLEGMAAGLIPIVSEYTGSKEAVEQVSGELIVPLEENMIMNKIIRLTSLPAEELEDLSARARQKAGEYLESAAIRNFKDSFGQLTKQLG